jgi:glycosyltransferase involved in cell wall biosynthesis
MYRLLVVIGNLDVGGTERHLVQVLPHLSKRGYQAMVFTLSHPGQLAPLLVQAGVPVLSPYFASALRNWPSWIRKPLLLPLCIASFCWTLRRVRPQLLHFFLPQAYLLGGLCSLLSGLWGQRPLRLMSRRSQNRYQKRHPALAQLEHSLHRKMDAVLGNSLAVMDELKSEGVPPTSLHLIYNGVDTSVLETLQMPGNRQSTRRSLGLTETALVLVCVANLIPYKGHLDLLEALGTVSQKFPLDWALLLVGSVPLTHAGQAYEKALQQRAKALGIANHVQFLGQRADVTSLYAAADIGVLASHEEGFSNSVLEGMAAGAAMVVTKVGGNAEAVEDGVSGWVVPPRDPAALAQALLHLGQNAALRERFAQAAQTRVTELFSLQACVDQYDQLYQGLLQGQKEPATQVFSKRLGRRR